MLFDGGSLCAEAGNGGQEFRNMEDQSQERGLKIGSTYDEFDLDEEGLEDGDEEFCNLGEDFDEEEATLYSIFISAETRMKFHFLFTDNDYEDDDDLYDDDDYNYDYSDDYNYDDDDYEDDDFYDYRKRVNIGIYQAKYKNEYDCPEYKVERKVWDKQVILDGEKASLTKEISLEKGVYLLSFEIPEESGIGEIGCEFSLTDVSTYATSISIPSKFYMDVDTSAQIPVTNVLPSGSVKKGIVWTSTNKNIAAVDNAGMVKAKNPGTCKIQATLKNGKKYTCSLYVEDIKFTSEKVYITKGETRRLKFKKGSPSAKWTSSRPEIVKVDQSGKITAKKKGSAVIQAAVGKRKITCKVQVETPKMPEKQKTIGKGSSIVLKMKGTKQEVSWSSSNKGVVEIKNGIATGKKKGKAAITAKVGAKKYTCKVNVVDNKLKTTSMKLAVKGKMKVQLKKRTSDVSWSSSDKKTADVKNGVVTGKKTGTAIITAKIGNVDYTCRVTVENPKLSSKNLKIKSGEKAVLKMKNTTMKVQWNSSDSKVATVNVRGEVTGRKKGHVVITAKAGGRKYTCNVKVQ